jgi:pimeloyl-ACP methyl ester carboxylesterase
VDSILGVMDALDIHRPVAMGCSIGGRVVLHLALQHPERFKALIGLQSGAHVAPYYNLEWLHRPDVHGGEVCAGIVSGLIGPHAKEVDRWKPCGTTCKAGPGCSGRSPLLQGRRRSARAGGPHRHGAMPALSADRRVRLLCTPDDSRALAQSIAGAQLSIMPGLGHFPMSEAPPTSSRT